jgi:hypothetical protein
LLANIDFASLAAPAAKKKSKGGKNGEDADAEQDESITPAQNTNSSSANATEDDASLLATAAWAGAQL